MLAGREDKSFDLCARIRLPPSECIKFYESCNVGNRIVDGISIVVVRYDYCLVQIHGTGRIDGDKLVAAIDRPVRGLQKSHHWEIQY
ncbi:hypothetical protein BGK43_00870 [Corynebacterium diphtheriae]|nr:hypothetical protein BGK43_00870 [Corynebacterium diphtheriae]